MPKTWHNWTVEMGDAGAEIAQSSVTPIIAETSPGTKHIQGTGTCFQLGEVKFLVTAGHVVEEAIRKKWPLLVLDSAPEGVPVREVPFLSNIHRSPDPEDIAVCILEPTTIEGMPNRRFLSLQHVSIGSVRPGLFYICGFPAKWAKPVEGGHYVGPFGYGAPLYTGSTATFGGYRPHKHILLERSEVGVIDRDGNLVPLLSEPGGISGCPLIQLHANNILPDQWSKDNLKIVGVLTGGFPEAFTATRWGMIAGTLWEKRPDLRPLLDLNNLTADQVNGPAVQSG